MIIVACAVLHNIAVEQNEENFEIDDNFEEFEEDEHHEEINNDGDPGARMPFINYFQNLLNNSTN